MVVIVPTTIPNVSTSTFATGARQFVVQEAFETTWCFAGSYAFSFTPSTNVQSGSVAGAVINTFLTDPRICLRASGPLVNTPDASTTICAPVEDQSSKVKSFTLETWIAWPST